MKSKVLLIILTICCSVVMLQTGCKSGTTDRVLADGVLYPVPSDFITVIDGKPVSLYTLENSNGLRVDITNYGGKIVSLFVPCKDGIFDDIVTGYHTIDEFVESEEIYFGALIGRYGNRIGKAKFTIDGVEYQLNANNGPNHLHGGPGGFHAVVWDAEQKGKQQLTLSYLSPHMEEGYPGNLNTEVVYELTDNDELKITYYATTDMKTHVNITSHAFFNLAGEGSTTINDHMLQINATYYTPVDEELIPTGDIATVANTPLDFRVFNRIGDRVDSDYIQMQYGMGYDHNFVLDRNAAIGQLDYAGAVYDPVSGRKMEVYTTEPALQFYGGNFLSGNEIGKRGEPYLHRTSFCLETQHFPDSPNQPYFPSTLLEPGKAFESTTIYKFTIHEE